MTVRPSLHHFTAIRSNLETKITVEHLIANARCQHTNIDHGTRVPPGIGYYRINQSGSCYYLTLELEVLKVARPRAREGANNNRTGAINLTAITAIFVYVETAARCPRLRPVQQPTLFPPTRRITLSSIRPRRFQLFSLSRSGDTLHHRVVAPDVHVGCERSQDSAESSLASYRFFQFICSVGWIEFFVRFLSVRYSPSHCCQLSSASSIDDPVYLFVKSIL